MLLVKICNSRFGIQSMRSALHTGKHKIVVRNPLTHEESMTLKKTFNAAANNIDDFTRHYYQLLLKYDSDLGTVIGNNQKDHVHKVTSLLFEAVQSSDSLSLLFPEIQELGKEHASLGITGKHHKIFGYALFDTLHHFLGERFDPHHQELWRRLYGALDSIAHKN